jgi:hypothetical protein
LSKRIVRALCVKRALDLVERDADALDDCRRVGGDERWRPSFRVKVVRA